MESSDWSLEYTPSARTSTSDKDGPEQVGPAALSSRRRGTNLTSMDLNKLVQQPTISDIRLPLHARRNEFLRVEGRT